MSSACLFWEATHSDSAKSRVYVIPVGLFHAHGLLARWRRKDSPTTWRCYTQVLQTQGNALKVWPFHHMCFNIVQFQRNRCRVGCENSPLELPDKDRLTEYHSFGPCSVTIPTLHPFPSRTLWWHEYEAHHVMGMDPPHRLCDRHPSHPKWNRMHRRTCGRGPRQR